METGTGTLALAGNVVSHPAARPATINGELSLNGVVRTFDVAGPDGSGALIVRSGSFQDATLTLAGDTVVQCVADEFDIHGGIAGPGGLAKVGEGTLGCAGSVPNTYAGATTVNSGMLLLVKSGSNAAIPGALIIGDNVGGAEADWVQLKSSDQIHDLAAVTIRSSGRLMLSGLQDWIGSLAGEGRVDLAAGDLIVGNNNASTTFSGLIRGAGGVISPGSSAGLLTCSNLTLDASSTFRVELSGKSPGFLGYPPVAMTSVTVFGTEVELQWSGGRPNYCRVRK